MSLLNLRKTQPKKLQMKRKARTHKHCAVACINLSTTWQGQYTHCADLLHESPYCKTYASSAVSEANRETEPEGAEQEGAREAEAEAEGRDSEEDEVNLRRYCPAGGPIILTLLELPPPPKNAGQWTIRRGEYIIQDQH